MGSPEGQKLLREARAAAGGGAEQDSLSPLLGDNDQPGGQAAQAEGAGAGLAAGAGDRDEARSVVAGTGLEAGSGDTVGGEGSRGAGKGEGREEQDTRRHRHRSRHRNREEGRGKEGNDGKHKEKGKGREKGRDKEQDVEDGEGEKMKQAKSKDEKETKKKEKAREKDDKDKEKKGKKEKSNEVEKGKKGAPDKVPGDNGGGTTSADKTAVGAPPAKGASGTPSAEKGATKFSWGLGSLSKVGYASGTPAAKGKGPADTGASPSTRPESSSPGKGHRRSESKGEGRGEDKGVGKGERKGEGKGGPKGEGEGKGTAEHKGRKGALPSIESRGKSPLGRDRMPRTASGAASESPLGRDQMPRSASSSAASVSSSSSGRRGEKERAGKADLPPSLFFALHNRPMSQEDAHVIGAAPLPAAQGASSAASPAAAAAAAPAAALSAGTATAAAAMAGGPPQSPPRGTAPGTPQAQKADIPSSLLVALHRGTVGPEGPRPASAGSARAGAGGSAPRGEWAGTPEVAHRAGPGTRFAPRAPPEAEAPGGAPPGKAGAAGAGLGVATAAAAAVAVTAVTAGTIGAGREAGTGSPAAEAAQTGGSLSQPPNGVGTGNGASPSGTGAQENLGNGHAGMGTDTSKGEGDADTTERGALGVALRGGGGGEGQGKEEGKEEGLDPDLAASLRLQEETAGIPVVALADAKGGALDEEAGRLLQEEWKEKRRREVRRRALLWGPVVLLLVVGAAVGGGLYAAGAFRRKQEYSLVPAPPGEVTASFLGGVCDSSNPPLIPQGAPTMPSFWWSSQLKNGSRAQLLSTKLSFWLGPLSPLPSASDVPLGPSLPLATAPNASSSSTFTIFLVTTDPATPPDGSPPGTLAAKLWVPQAPGPSGGTPGGWVVVEDDTVKIVAGSSSSLESGAGTLLWICPVSDTEVGLRTSSGDYLTASASGAPLAPQAASSPGTPSGAPGDAQRFSVRHAATVQAMRGVNLGGWLVAEKWMDPAYFDGVPGLIDGVAFSLRGQGAGGGRLVRANIEGAGELACASDSVGTWELFYLRLATDAPYALPPSSTYALNIRAYDGRYWTTTSAGNSQNSQKFQKFQQNQGSQKFQKFQQNQGSQKFQKFQNSPSSQNSRGVHGSQNSRGPRKSRRLHGFQKSQGLRGMQASRKSHGSQNPQGPRKSRLLQGFQGVQGSQNPRGLQGPQGSRNSRGLQGSGSSGGGPAVSASAPQALPYGDQTFTFFFSPAVAPADIVPSAQTQPLGVLIQASGGKFLQTAADGSITADYELADKGALGDAGNPVWANSSALFLFSVESQVVGEWQLSAGLPPAARAGRVAAHRSAFVSEVDFSQLPSDGVNAVRVPVGYWIWQPAGTPGPFVAGDLDTLDRLISWGETYGVRVLVCLHAAAGSQNGFNHSAPKDGIPMFQSQPISLSIGPIEHLAQRYASSPAFLGIGLLNEPNSRGASVEFLQQYYTAAYQAVRRHAPCAYVTVGLPVDSGSAPFDGFMTSPLFSNVVLDVHFYNVFEPALADSTYQENIDYVNTVRADELAKMDNQGSRLTMVGEWSLALPFQSDDGQATGFASAQLATYGRASAGWFFWSLKLSGNDLPNWSWQDAIFNGWMGPNSQGLWP